MKNKQKKPEPVVFDTPEDLLIAMIRGRSFELNGNEYSFSKKLSSFMYLYDGSGIVYPHGIGENKEVVTDISLICEVLVGKKLKELDPIHIEVDTLLCVLNCPIVKGSTSITPQLNYFSHWSEGKLYCFAEGTTSLTATKTVGWRYWEFAKEEVCLVQN